MDIVPSREWVNEVRRLQDVSGRCKFSELALKSLEVAVCNSDVGNEKLLSAWASEYLESDKDIVRDVNNFFWHWIGNTEGIGVTVFMPSAQTLQRYAPIVHEALSTALVACNTESFRQEPLRSFMAAHMVFDDQGKVFAPEPSPTRLLMSQVGQTIKMKDDLSVESHDMRSSRVNKTTRYGDHYVEHEINMLLS